MKRLNKLTLGIIGLGRIGGSVAKKFLPFSRKIGFYDPYLPNGYEKVYGIKRFQTLKNLLNESDIVSINTPLNGETKEMIDEDFLEMMKTILFGKLDPKEFYLQKVSQMQLYSY